jgi:hypothetical protein
VVLDGLLELSDRFRDVLGVLSAPGPTDQLTRLLVLLPGSSTTAGVRCTGGWVERPHMGFILWLIAVVVVVVGIVRLLQARSCSVPC